MSMKEQFSMMTDMLSHSFQFVALTQCQLSRCGRCYDDLRKSSIE